MMIRCVIHDEVMLGIRGVVIWLSAWSDLQVLFNTFLQGGNGHNLVQWWLKSPPESFNSFWCRITIDNSPFQTGESIFFSLRFSISRD